MRRPAVLPDLRWLPAVAATCLASGPAFAEVSDGLTGFVAAQAVRDALRDAVAAARRSVEIADVRYREGVTSYLEVLDAQRALATSRLELLQSERAVLREVVRVHRALGGGW